jgi:hypothetical protein
VIETGTMPSVTVSIHMPVDIYELSKKYRLNRSAISRNAIKAEIKRIEQEYGIKPATV